MTTSVRHTICPLMSFNWKGSMGQQKNPIIISYSFCANFGYHLDFTTEHIQFIIIIIAECPWLTWCHLVLVTIFSLQQQSQKFRLLFIFVYSGTGIVLAMFALWYLSLAVDEIRYVISALWYPFVYLPPKNSNNSHSIVNWAPIAANWGMV